MKAITATFDEIMEYTDLLIEANKIERDIDGILKYEINPCGDTDLFTAIWVPVVKKSKKLTTVTEQNRRAGEEGMEVSKLGDVITISCDRTGAVIYQSNSITSIQRKITQIKKQRLHDRVNAILNLHVVC